MQRPLGLAAPLIASLIATALLAEPARAQYFGQNKVQYHSFHFKVLRTAHFDIYYYPEEKEGVTLAARLAERWYARYAKLLNHDLRGRQPLILYASPADFQQTNAVSGPIGESTGGVTEVLKRRMVLPLAGPLAETNHVLGHELVHAFQYDITGHGGPVTSTRAPGATRLPLWFIEGMAEYLSLGPLDPHTAMWMRDAVAKGDLPSIKNLDNPKYFPYRWGQALWAYIAGRWGDPVVGRMLRKASEKDIDSAFKDVLGEKREQVSKDWKAALEAAYQPLEKTRKDAGAYAKALITKKSEGGSLNVTPSLSPDGRHLAFLSERGEFSIDLYLADARTGKVEKTLLETALDPHLQSIEFASSSGGWDAQSRRLAFAAVSDGQSVLEIFDVTGRKKRRELHFPTLGEITHPTWAPDGRRIAFSAIRGGLTDLYVYDLKTAKLRRLTQDPYAELQPAWSPDGKAIAFVTDRFTLDLDDLAMGAYQLALIDPETGRIHRLGGLEGSKNINPQWSADGRSIYFLSDHRGATNVYRMQVADGGIERMTDLLTGVSGITASSPALSVAGPRDAMAFSVYEHGDYDIYTTASPAPLEAVSSGASATEVATLPPDQRKQPVLERLESDAVTGLPDPARFRNKPYHPHLSLDYVGEPYATVGTDSFGTYLGGGASLFFSDILGNHDLGLAIQANGGFKDIGGAVSYTNLSSRWNWGLTLERIPYRTGAFQTAVGQQNGQLVEEDDTLIFRQTNQLLEGTVAYPFNQAERLELSAGVQRISFSGQQQTDLYSLDTGGLLQSTKQNLASPSPLTFARGSAALVYDTSLFGATSPILGRRFRLEVDPVAGSVRYTDLLADFRQYLMPVRPYTLAFRLLHYGRYGSGAEDQRLIPLFLGYPDLVRGYDTGSFSAGECTSGAPGTCPVFDQLLGSRLLVANAELRFPPFGAITRKGFYGPVPLELGAFFDAGVAWDSQVSPSLFGGNRSLVKSVGFLLRANVLGYLVAELDFVNPLDRPQKGWFWQFNISPGF